MNSTFLGNIDGKNAETKRQILGLCINNDFSIAELSRELNTSIPTITKLVGELIDERFLADMGKMGTSGGRRPSIFGLNASAGYLLGVEAARDSMTIAVTDFKGHLVEYKDQIPFALDSSEASFKQLTATIKEHLGQAGIQLADVLACGINLSGRVNSSSGYSFTYFVGEDRPLTEILEAELGMPVTIENDSRAMTYGEYLCGDTSNAKNMIFINASWGLGMGMILDGKLYYGKSGFSGEIGHFPMLDNDHICHCGKLGCLETGASGSAVHRIIVEKLKEGKSSILAGKFRDGSQITAEDIIAAVQEEDVLAIESVEQIGATLGRAIAGIINLFNPELVVIGGKLAAAKDYIMLPLKSNVNKFSLNLVSRDTSIKLSKLGSKAGPLGACLLSRSKLLGLM